MVEEILQTESSYTPTLNLTALDAQSLSKAVQKAWIRWQEIGQIPQDENDPLSKLAGIYMANLQALDEIGKCWKKVLRI